ncbi:MAG: four helix bundle protein [Planctomycetia bacterium]|nr:four helix bundle protein [Planctomycetia bacterium]
MGIKRHTELDVYKRSFETAMVVFRMTKTFPQEERYSLVDQIRRSSRSVSANLAEAWRKRRYEAAFVAKLSDCEAEAAETQVWLQFAVERGYADRENAKALYSEYDELIAMLVHMINHASDWTIK